jgi:hypothetical protein
MHVADWKATYANGVAGLSDAQTADGGAFGDESKNHWPYILQSGGGGGGSSDDDGSSSDDGPRAELVHSVHTPSSIYPGNCTIDVWGGRNCAAVLTTSNGLKLMLGFVGDPRRIPLNESTRGATVPFGRSGGKCGLAGFAERCEAPGNPSTRPPKPKPKPDDPGGCLHGCLFDLKNDLAESRNLINDTRYAADVARMRGVLAAAGARAPPWFQMPERSNLGEKALGDALCAAAHRGGGVLPADF